VPDLTGEGDRGAGRARVLPMGESGLLVETPRVLAVLRALSGSAQRPAGVLDLVPAARTLLVGFDPRAADPAAVRRWLDQVLAGLPDGDPVAPGPASGPAGAVTLRVTYDGPDLDDVARLTGLTRDGVVAAHTGAVWSVAFTGFAPGFGYLVRSDPGSDLPSLAVPSLEVPRLEVPRTRVPAGSVALAGRYSGVYPTASPGGWRIVGRTDAVLWDVERDPPALLQPGLTVRFEDVTNPRPGTAGGRG